MKNIKFNDIINILVMVLLCLTPLFNIGEVWKLISFQFLPYAPKELHTPIYIKLIKDTFFILIISLGLLKTVLRKSVIRQKYYYLFFIFAALSFLLSVFKQDFLLTLAGIRFLFPLLLFSAFFDTIDKRFQQKLCKILIFLFVLNFLLQTYQYWLHPIIGRTRNPGIFAMPSTTAFFSLSFMYYIYHFFKDNISKKILLYFLGPVSVLFTGSGAGFIGMVFFFIIIAYFKIHHKWILALLCIPVILILFISLPKILHRKNIYSSPVKRLRLFKESLLQKDVLLSTNFGSGTRSANILKRTYNRTFAKVNTDSTITAVVTCLGVIPLIFLLLFILRPIQFQILHLHFLCIFGLFAMTTIIFEAFPANLLFMINLSYLYNQKKFSFLKKHT